MKYAKSSDGEHYWEWRRDCYFFSNEAGTKIAYSAPDYLVEPVETYYYMYEYIPASLVYNYAGKTTDKRLMENFLVSKRIEGYYLNKIFILPHKLDEEPHVIDSNPELMLKRERLFATIIKPRKEQSQFPTKGNDMDIRAFNPNNIYASNNQNYLVLKVIDDKGTKDERTWYYLYEYDDSIFMDQPGYKVLGYTGNIKAAIRCLEYGPGGITITIPSMLTGKLPRYLEWTKYDVYTRPGRKVSDLKEEEGWEFDSSQLSELYRDVANEIKMYSGNKDNIKHLIKGLLFSIGEDADRPGLKDTPKRVANFWDEFINYEPGNIDTQFVHNGFDQIVLVKDIPFYSLCEHHLLPFWGTISVAYIARGRVLGLSKIPRIVQKYAHRLQLQEQLCQQIATEMSELLQHNDVAVIGSATHSCMAMRGIKSDGVMKTSVMWGKFRNEPETRSELFALLKD